MFLQFEAGQLSDVVVPEKWARYVSQTSTGVRVTGDRTGARELYFYCGNSFAAMATRLGDLLEQLRQRDVVPKISDFAISATLHHALVPIPYTEYEGVFFLAMGDSADIGLAEGSLTVTLSHEYPWLSGHSRGDQKPSEEKLLRLLVAATEREVAEAGNDGFLMLSSGKDSPAVALALAEAGLNHIPCVTYSSGPDDPEPPIAADICRRLGLKHEIVEMPSDPATTSEVLTRFFEASARPGVDLSQVPYVFATAAAGYRSGSVFDGGGNDSYMGLPVGGHDLTKLRFRLRGARLSALAQRMVPVDSPVNYLARSRAEGVLPGRTMRLHESRAIFSHAVNTSPYWRDVSRLTDGFSLVDLFGAVTERHQGPGGSMQKQVLAADALGMGASLPWCDHAVADYYFNLPEHDRYSHKPVKNKLLLRKMLLRYLDYDADVIGKHYFSFDGAGFIVRNMDFVRSEIDSCGLWDAGGLGLINGWLDQIGSRPLLYHSLLTVFMVSGWHNHSRYLKPQLAARARQAVA
jgi:hypothetical protein